MSYSSDEYISCVQSDFERSHRSAKGNYFKIAHGYAAFLEYCEEMAENLKQPAICRAYASYFDRHEQFRNWPPERDEKLKKRSDKRHMHIYSRLQNREIGQNVYGRRSLSSTISNSECREYRFDQTIWGDDVGETLKWKNRQILFEDSGTLVEYDDAMNEQHDFEFKNGSPVIDMLYVEPDCRNYETIPGCERYMITLVENSIEAHSLEDPGKMIGRYELPRNWKYEKVGWKTVNESIFVHAKCYQRVPLVITDVRETLADNLFLIFDAFPFTFRTSFKIAVNATPEDYEPIHTIKIKNKFIEVMTQNDTLIYAYQDVLEKNKKNSRISGELLIHPMEELPIFFEIWKLGEPLAEPKNRGEYDLKLMCSSTLPLLVTIEKEFAVIDNLKNNHIMFDKVIPAFSFENGRYGTSGYFDSSIFPDPFSSTFLLIENRDFVKYNVTNCAEKGLKVEKIWSTSIFPKGSGPENISDFMKIYETNFDNENLFVKVSIDYAHLKPNGCLDKFNDVKIYLLYVIDYTNGEILRIIPIHRNRYEDIFKDSFLEGTYDPFLIEEDLMIFQKEKDQGRSLEVWELIEPQQYIDQNGKIEEKVRFMNRKDIVRDSEYTATEYYY